MSEIGGTRCQILRLKCIKFDFRQTPLEELTALPRPFSYIKGPTPKGRKEKGKGGKEKGRNGKEGGGGRGRDLAHPKWR